MLQTVIEISLGIVLAALILRYLSRILKIGLVLIVFAAVTFAAFYFLDNETVIGIGHTIVGIGLLFAVFGILPLLLGIVLLALPILNEQYSDKPSLFIEDDTPWLSHIKLLFSYYHFKGLVGIVCIFIIVVTSSVLFGDSI